MGKVNKRAFISKTAAQGMDCRLMENETHTKRGCGVETNRGTFNTSHNSALQMSPFELVTTVYTQGGWTALAPIPTTEELTRKGKEVTPQGASL
jgi:hypothetical protein